MTKHIDGAHNPSEHPLEDMFEHALEESLEHSTENPDALFWYNERTGEVEEGPQSIARYRIGPFATRAEAARALQVVAERAREWNAEDGDDD